MNAIELKIAVVHSHDEALAELTEGFKMLGIDARIAAIDRAFSKAHSSPIGSSDWYIASFASLAMTNVMLEMDEPFAEGGTP